MNTEMIYIIDETQTQTKSIDRLQKSLEKTKKQMQKLFYQKSELPSDKFADAMQKTANLIVNVSVNKISQKETSGVYQTSENSFDAQSKQNGDFGNINAPQRIVQAVDRMAKSIETALAPQTIDGVMQGAMETGKSMFDSIKMGFGKFKEGFSFLDTGIFQRIKEIIPTALVDAANGIGGVLGTPIAGLFGVIGKIGSGFIEAKTKLGENMVLMGAGVGMLGNAFSEGSNILLKGAGVLIQGVGFFFNKGISGVMGILGQGIGKSIGTVAVAISMFGTLFSQNSGKLQKAAGMALQGVAAFTSRLGGFLNATFREVGNVVGVVGEGFGNLVGFVGSGIQSIIQKVTGNIGNIGKFFISGFGIIGGIVKGIFGFIGGAIKAAWAGIQNLVVNPIVNYEGSISAATGYQQLFQYSKVYSDTNFDLAPSGTNNQIKQNTDWSAQGFNHYIEEMKNGDYRPTNGAAAFEDMLNNIGMSGVYSLESTAGIGKGYLNSGKTVASIEKELIAIQDTAAAFNLSEQEYQELAGKALQIGESETVSLQDITQGFKVPMLEMVARGLGETEDAAGMERVKQRIANGEFTGKQIMDLFYGVVEKEQDDGGLKGVAEDLSNSTVSGLKTKLTNLFKGNISKKWARGLTEGLGDGVKGGMGGIGKFIDDHKQAFEQLGNIAQGIGNSLGKFGAGAIQNTIERMETLFSSTEFQEAGLADKMKLFWDNVIKKPFDDWWQSTGDPLVSGVLDSIGNKMGEGLTGFLSILFGVDEKETLADGEKAGTGFTQGFARGFDGEKVMNAFADMLSKVLEKIWDNIWNKPKEIEVDGSASNYGDFFDSEGNMLPGVDETQLSLYKDDKGSMRTGQSQYIYGGDESLIQRDHGYAAKQGEFEDKVAQVKTETETGLGNISFDKAIENYNGLDEKQKEVLDAGLEKINALNQEFAFLGNAKYADIIVSVFYGDKEVAIDSRIGTIITGGTGRFNKDVIEETPEQTIPHAKGGIFTNAHVGLVAEAGPEAIIPLSGTYKNNGISLWEKAGYLLGTLPKHAEGGIFGEIDEEKNGRTSFSLANIKQEEENNADSVSNFNAPIQINTTVTGTNFTFQGGQTGDKEGIMQVIKEQMPTIADEIAGTIAVNIQRIFANMKKETI